MKVLYLPIQFIYSISIQYLNTFYDSILYFQIQINFQIHFQNQFYYYFIISVAGLQTTISVEVLPLLTDAIFDIARCQQNLNLTRNYGSNLPNLT